MYSPKNVLITGSAGFIASNVSVFLTKKYENINFINLDKIDYCSDLSNLDEIKTLPNFKFIRGDICSYDLIQYILDSENIDTIMHFAASSCVDNSFGNSFTFTQNNVMGTHVLLEAAKNYGKISKFIFVSSDEVYDYSNEDGIPRSEEHKLLPCNPYAASKAAAEMMCNAYIKSFNLPIIITRSNNIYGKFQYPEKIIPKFINQLIRGRKLTLHGNGSNLRNYLHVDDVVRAFDIILFKGKIFETYNIASSVEKSNLEVAKQLVILHLGNSESITDEQISSYFQFVEDRCFNDLRYKISSDKIKELGWTEQISWEEGINQTFNWYINNQDKYTKNIEIALSAHPRHGL